MITTAKAEMAQTRVASQVCQAAMALVVISYLLATPVGCGALQSLRLLSPGAATCPLTVALWAGMAK